MPWSLRENNNNMTHIQAKHVSVAFGTVSPSGILMCPLVFPKLTKNLLDPPISTGSVHSSLIHRLLCGGGKKKEADTHCSHMHQGTFVTCILLHHTSYCFHHSFIIHTECGVSGSHILHRSWHASRILRKLNMCKQCVPARFLFLSPCTRAWEQG